MRGLLFIAPVLHAGFRIGKGEGYADMEYGMMASMEAVSDSTVVVTIVHDCQVSCLLTTCCFATSCIEYFLMNTDYIKTN